MTQPEKKKTLNKNINDINVWVIIAAGTFGKSQLNVFNYITRIRLGLFVITWGSFVIRLGSFVITWHVLFPVSYTWWQITCYHITSHL